MAFSTSYIIAPLVGSIIGYITNDLAIRMLFHPHAAKYVFGVHVPFTPGIIPKEKGRIAKAIGGVISENLMNHEVLEQYLLSDAMVDKLRSAVDGFIETQKNNAETLGEFLGHYLSEEEMQGIAEGIKGNLGKQMKAKLSDEAIGDKVAHIAMEHVMDNLSNNDSEELLEQIVGFLIGSELDNFLNTPVQKLLAGKDEQLRKVTNKIEMMYRTVITEHLPRILETIDISKIVCDRINDMDVAEAEKLILQVMNKELKAIVWLGAALGFLMGWVNVIV